MWIKSNYKYLPTYMLCLISSSFLCSHNNKECCSANFIITCLDKKCINGKSGTYTFRLYNLYNIQNKYLDQVLFSSFCFLQIKCVAHEFAYYTI